MLGRLSSRARKKVGNVQAWAGESDDSRVQGQTDSSSCNGTVSRVASARRDRRVFIECLSDPMFPRIHFGPKVASDGSVGASKRSSRSASLSLSLVLSQKRGQVWIQQASAGERSSTVAVARSVGGKVPGGYARVERHSNPWLTISGATQPVERRHR